MLILPSGMLLVTVLSVVALKSTLVKADSVDRVSVTLSNSCTMTGSGIASHSASIINGQYDSTVGETTANVICNDSSGFAVYAIGYTDDILGNNVLTDSILGDTYNIVTGTQTSGANSQWAMKLAPDTAQSPAYPLIIAGSTTDTLKEQNDPDFSSFQEAPSSYTKVAYRTTSTDAGAGATGSTFRTTYQVYVSSTQPAGAYEGQVKYVLVHPNTAPAPIVPPAPQASCDTPFPASTGITYMQQINSTNRTSVLAALTEDQHYYLRDSRDEEPYCVVKLADGNLWLADNLRLDLTNATILAGINETNTNASNTTLGYLKGDTTRDPINDPYGQYATAAVADWTNSYSYSVPLVNVASKNSTNSSDSLSNEAKTWKYGTYYNYCAASAGSYCFGNGTSESSSSGNATEDICPKNWRLPTSKSTGEYGSLYSYTNYDTTAKYRSALRLPLSGYYLSNSANYQGSSGYWWSSTRYGLSKMYYLVSYENSFNGSSHDYTVTRGYSLRCILAS